MIIFCGYLTKIIPDYVTALLFTFREVSRVNFSRCCWRGGVGLLGAFWLVFLGLSCLFFVAVLFSFVNFLF